MASKNGMSDSQADAVVTMVVVFTLVAAAVYWVSTAG